MKSVLSKRACIRAQIALCGVIALGFISSCQVFGIASAIGQNIERDKKIEVLAKYAGLDNKRVAILVKADMGTVYEYRLNPPGNRFLWDGVAAGNVGVAERDGLDADQTVDQWNVSAQFPLDAGVTRESMPITLVQKGLLSAFVRNAAWVFFDHIEDKYPDTKK